MKFDRKLALLCLLVCCVALAVTGFIVGLRLPDSVWESSPDTYQGAQKEFVIWQELLWGALAGLIVAIVLARWAGKSIGSPVDELGDIASAIANGDLKQRPSLLETGSVAKISDAIRRISDQSNIRLEALKAEEARIVALTEALNEGVIALDARHQVQSINETARQILRLRVGTPFPADYLPRDRTLREALNAVMHGEIVHPSEVRVDDKTLSLTARPLPDGGAIIALYDLTPSRKLEAVRRDFVANVSHELRTPLTIISGFIETLEDEALPPELRKQFLEMTESNVRRMQRIVDDLLDLSRIESGGWLPNSTMLSLAQLAEEIVCPLSGQANDKGIDLVVSLNDDARDVYADPTALRQILSNLTQNAIRHTSKGSVELFTEKATNGIWIGVRDTGEGIPQEHLPRIFERFYRADHGRTRDSGGTGLGLAIVKHLVEAHGGTVKASSRQGYGTTISAFFPN